MKKILICVLLLISILCFGCAYAKEFQDVPQTHWAYKFISELSEQGVINGYEDGSFNPSGTITQAEFIKLITVADQGDSMFKTIKPGVEWYVPYFSIANSLGCLSDEVKEEMHAEKITRKDMANILYNFSFKNKFIAEEDNEDVGYTERVEELTEEEYLKEINNENQSFNDIDELSFQYERAILDMNKIGLLNGYEDGSFKPENTMTRAEVATVIYRFQTLKMGGTL